MIGAGFGGLATAKALRRTDVNVTVIDRHNYHLFQPLLYQVATGLLDPSDIAYPIRRILRRSRNVRVHLADLRRIDLDRKRLVTSGEDVEYDVLVVATGSVTDFFGNTSLAARLSGLKHLTEALALRALLLRNFEAAALCRDEAERRRLLTVAVVGAGPTGVEYCGAVAELINHVLPRDFPELDFREARVVLIEAGDGALTAFAPQLGRSAIRSLERRGVRAHFGGVVTDARDGSLLLEDGSSIPAATVLWTAGVRPAAPAWSGRAVTTERGRIVVTPQLHLPDRPEVFVIGDGAATASGARVLPMLAPVAMQGGRHVARVIRARLRNRPSRPSATATRGRWPRWAGAAPWPRSARFVCAAFRPG